ncbi:MAG: hypothetical protein ACTHMC_01590 [Pseudobacter sp.]|uniref:hypothetical protein n=1 Tax=Pseudobacter sp. TaxID=2045420 RepID=UPI003F822786
MRHDNDDLPMTPEKQIRLKAHYYIMRFRNQGITWEKSKVAAIILVIELRDLYLKHFRGTPEQRQKAYDNFARLEHAINAY